MENLLAFVRSHGFDAVIFRGKIVFEVPFTNVRTGETGDFTYTVANYRDARIALGY